MIFASALKATCDSRDGQGNRGDRGDRGNRGNRGERCFSKVYPLTISFPDGTSEEVADRDAAKAVSYTHLTLPTICSV